MHFDVIRQGNNIGAMGAARSLVLLALRVTDLRSPKITSKFIKITTTAKRASVANPV